MPTTARSQQRYDHRLRNLVQRTGDVTFATDLGVPRSTASGWLIATPTVVVCLDVADLTEPELRQEVLKLRRRVHKLMALLRLALALLRTSGFNLTRERLPEGRAKIRILRAVDRAREHLPLRAVLPVNCPRLRPESDVRRDRRHTTRGRRRVSRRGTIASRAHGTETEYESPGKDPRFQCRRSAADAWRNRGDDQPGAHMLMIGQASNGRDIMEKLGAHARTHAVAIEVRRSIIRLQTSR
jgi:hypothetical protein